MRKPGLKIVALIVAAGITLAGQGALARIDVRTAFDKAFDFKNVRTWNWNRQGAGEVKMARTPEDDPEVARQRAEPIILDAVTKEMAARKFQFTTGNPDVFVIYYLLLSTSMSAQVMGDFLPATTIWAIPPFLPATQSLKFMNRGSLVLDLSAKDAVVWRGVAQADIKMDATEKRREELIREAVRDLLKRFPPKT